jgi:hypothetical protein
MVVATKGNTQLPCFASLSIILSVVVSITSLENREARFGVPGEWEAEYAINFFYNI